MALSKEELRESIKVTNAEGIVPEQPAPETPTEEAPAPEPEVEEPVVAAVEEVPVEAEPEPEVEEEMVSKAEMLKRINAKNAKIAQLEAAANAQPQRDENTPLTQEDIERIADQKAEAKLFERDCNRVAAEATKLNPTFMEEWDDVIDPKKGGIGYPSNELLSAIIDLDNSPQILNILAKDSTKLEQLYSLRGAKLGVALAKISEDIKKPKPKPVSRAPAPIEPVGGGNRTPGVLRDDMPMDQWVKLREQNRRKPNFR